MGNTHLKSRVQYLEDFVGHVRESMAFMALVELGVFRELAKSPFSVEPLAELTGTGTRRLTQFLNMMVALGILSRDGDLYSLVPGDEEIFREGSSFERTFSYDVKKHFEGLSQSVEILRSDTPRVHAGAGGEVDEKQREEFLLFLDSRSQEVATEVAEITGKPSVRKILDVGSGAGTYSRALLKKLPEATAILFDRPNAETLVRRCSAKDEVGDRVEFRGGDFFEDDLGEDYDLILLSNLVHCYSPELNGQLFERLALALSPDGQIAVKEFHVLEDRSGPRKALRFGLLMALASEGGDVYSPGDIEAFGKPCGFHLESSHILEAAPESVLCVLRRSFKG